VGVPARPRASSGASFQDLVRESFATVVALGDVFVWNRQPRFLGPVIPIDGDGRATRDRAPARRP
jgi:vancomycin permeability regulator SanA